MWCEFNLNRCVPAACNVWYLCSVEMESLTGVQAVQKATSMTLSADPPPTSTVVHFKVSSQGITLTDNQRKWVPHRHIYTTDTCTGLFLTITTPCLLLGSSSGGITMSIRSYFVHWTLKIESEYYWFIVWTYNVSACHVRQTCYFSNQVWCVKMYPGKSHGQWQMTKNPKNFTLSLVILNVPVESKVQCI